VGISAFNRLREGVATAFNAISGFINQFIPNLNLINFSFEDLARFSAQALDGVIAAFRAAAAAVREISQNFGTVLSEAFTIGFNAAIGVVEDGINFIVNGIGELPGLLFDLARDAVASFASVFDIGFDEIVGFVAGIPGRIKDAFTGLFEVGKEAGTSLIEGIDEAIDVEVDPVAGRIAVKLGRLETPASGALREVGRVAGEEFSRSIESAPVTGALEGVLDDARVRAVAKAKEVGGEVGRNTVQAASEAVIQEKSSFSQALEGLVDAVVSFSGLTQQQFENLTSNISTILGGADLGGAFNSALQGVANLIGASRSDLGNALGGVFNILGELGFQLEDVFGKRGTKAIRLLSVVTSEQFRGILNVASGVFTSIGPLITGIIPSLAAFGSAAVASFSSAAAAATAFAISLGPITLTILAIAAVVIVLIAIFGDLGDAIQFLIDLFTKLGGDGSTAAKILQIVFAPVVLPILAIVKAVEFLINLFGALGNSGSTAGRILAVVFAPIILPILAIVRAVEFLIDLFRSLGNVGSATGTILRLVLAPIVIPIRLIIEVIQFLIRLFGDLGGAVRVFGAVFTGVFNAILAVARGVFNAILAITRAVFAAIAAAGRGLFNVLSGLLNGFSGLFGNVLNGILRLTRSVFSGIIGAGQSAFKALSGVASGIAGAFTSAFGRIAGAAKSAFASVVSAAKSAASASIGLLTSITGAIGGIGGGIIGSIGGVVGGISGGIKKIGSSVKKGLKKLSPFAKGGVITGPVSLMGEGLGGKAFRRGGRLPPTTLLGGAENITKTSNLGIAGEAGPEAILPLSRTSEGLGVVASLSDNLIQAIRSGSGQGDGSGGATIINRIVLISTKSETVEELQEQVLDLGASVEQRVDVRLADVLSEAV
ncbi:MAG: hypothetical protein ACR2QF_05635, partial [Geminicoccaceae bacterium]